MGHRGRHRGGAGAQHGRERGHGAPAARAVGGRGGAPLALGVRDAPRGGGPRLLLPAAAGADRAARARQRLLRAVVQPARHLAGRRHGRCSLVTALR